MTGDPPGVPDANPTQPLPSYPRALVEWEERLAPPADKLSTASIVIITLLAVFTALGFLASGGDLAMAYDTADSQEGTANVFAQLMWYPLIAVAALLFFGLVVAVGLAERWRLFVVTIVTGVLLLGLQIAAFAAIVN